MNTIWQINDGYYHTDIDNLNIKIGFTYQDTISLTLTDTDNNYIFSDDEYRTLIEVENEINYYFRYKIDLPTIDQIIIASRYH